MAGDESLKIPITFQSMPYWQPKSWRTIQAALDQFPLFAADCRKNGSNTSINTAELETAAPED